jgi:hypothetical protein
MNNRDSNQSLLKIVTFGLIFFGLLFSIVVFMLSERDPSKGMFKTLGISFTAITNGLLFAMCYSAFGKPSTKNLSIGSCITVAVSFLMSAMAILGEVESQGFAKMLFTVFLASIALAQICLLYKIDIVTKYAAISRIIAVVAIAIFTFTLIIMIWGDFAEMQYRIMGGGIYFVKSYLALLAIDFTFTAVTPLLNKLDMGRYEPVDDVTEDFLKDVD